MNYSAFDKKLYTKRVNVKELLPGDILAYDVFFSDGRLVAKSGVELTPKTLASLAALQNRIVTLDLTKAYQEAVKQSRSLFDMALKGKKLDEKVVHDMLEPFLKEVKREKNYIKLFYQLKSLDDYTFQHSINIAIIAQCIGKWLGYKDTELDEIALAGALHDIGKSRIPNSILNKPGPLTKEEFEIIKTHTILGCEILENQGNHPGATKLTALQHHERCDGSGYPYGIYSEHIHPYAKIVAVADVYHAMNSQRVYQEKRNPFLVLDEMQKSISTLDSKIVLVFIDKMISSLMSNRVLLSNGQHADILKIDKYNLPYPMVKIVRTDKIIDLAETDEDITIEDIIL